MGKASRDKGKRGERDARDAVKEHWGSPKCMRAAQANGTYSADLLHALPGTHVEVKRIRRIVATDYLVQASMDKEAHEIPVVLMREDNGTRWVLMLYLEDSEAFVGNFLQNQIEQEK